MKRELAPNCIAGTYPFGSILTPLPALTLVLILIAVILQAVRNVEAQLQINPMDREYNHYLI
jgi:hypothetical protein